jgi:shikimate dehydrogenase|tara:strand:- start:76 stop:837 length:762 start_codon:yes stop_codon:yes gene_type:complete
MIKKGNKKQFGLIGKNIDYSFSRQYFTDKFKKEALKDYEYVNFDIKNIKEFAALMEKNEHPEGLNVTIPYKKQVIPFLNNISHEAKAIGAVNTIVWDKNGQSTGHNTDYVGFEKSLLELTDKPLNRALILGTGGASGAIKFVLDKLNCEVTFVSRTPKKKQLSYKTLDQTEIEKTDLIVNTTPLGTFPDIDKCPPIPYRWINKQHLLFDLIYNPEETLFLKKGKKEGAKTSNGHRMLLYQAEKAWKLWNIKQI